MKNKLHPGRYSLVGSWHWMSLEMYCDGRWQLLQEYAPGDYVWNFSSDGLLRSTSNIDLPFVARYDYGFGGLLSFEGVDFLRGERHARIAECWGVEWEGESEAEIILYDCDDDALLLPRRIRMMRV